MQTILGCDEKCRVGRTDPLYFDVVADGCYTIVAKVRVQHQRAWASGPVRPVPARLELRQSGPEIALVCYQYDDGDCPERLRDWDVVWSREEEQPLTPSS